jgi:predicted transcriptional regulator
MKLDPSEMFKVLGVDTRIRIIELLKSRGPLGAKNIAELVGITLDTVFDRRASNGRLPTGIE